MLTFLHRFRRSSRATFSGARPGLGWVAALILAGACAGCLGKSPRPWDDSSAEIPRTLVFGKISLISEVAGISRPASMSGGGGAPLSLAPMLKLSLFQVETGQRGDFAAIEPDGSFVQPLPRGTYLILLTRPAPTPVNEVLAALQSPGTDPPRYLGTLNLQLEPGRGTNDDPDNFVVTSVVITDEMAATANHFAERYPDLTAGIARSPMVTDPAFTSLFYSYSRRNCEELLARHGLLLLDSSGKR